MIPTRPTTSISTTSLWSKGKTLAVALLLATMAALTLQASIADAAPSTFTVTNTNESGPGSLRQAIIDSESNSNPGDTDTIEFDIQSGCAAGSGVCTISPNNRLPDGTEPVIIDGYSQPGASPNTLSTGNNAELKIELSGADAGQVTGLFVDGSNSVVKGLIINRWKGAGVVVFTASGTRIEGNHIGTDASGTRDLGNRSSGVGFIDVTNSVVGGTSAAARNIISGNGSGVLVNGFGGNRIEGNYVGTDASGREDLGNGGDGVRIFDTTNNVVGGISAAARNIVSGNGGGVVVTGEASDNRIEGNYIGTNAFGQADLGNLGRGVLLVNSPDNTIGGATAAAGNVISNSGLAGVQVAGSGSVGNSILTNSIFDNGELGINLDAFTQDPSEVNPNDRQDPDTGENNLQNYPVISSATRSGGQTTIQGTLNSNPNSDLTIQFFRSPTADPSGFGEGKTYLGQTNVTTDASGDASFTFTATAVGGQQVIAATATNSVTGDTSEFSRVKEVEDNTPPTVVSTNPRDGATGVLAAVNVSATFSEQMKASTINTTTFKLFRKVGTTDQRVPAAVSYNAAYRKAVLDPNANLVPGGRYVAQVTTGVQDVSGNGLAQRKDFSFTVRR